MTKRVLVAMSGGVDSSVTAFLLKEQGYDCIGATMLLHGAAAPGACGSGSDADDAAAIARRLGFPHEVIDMRETFEREVVGKFAATYEAGRTPNPCIDCNRHLKFGALLDRALELGCDYISTGHYAQVRPLKEVLADAGAGDLQAPAGQERTGGESTGAEARGAIPGTAIAPAATLPEELLEKIARRSGKADRVQSLSCGVDPSKDQSYVLYSLTQERLVRTLLPLGGLVKEHDVRRIAREQGFENASKRDSQGICFVPNGDFAALIEARRGRPLPEGDIVNAAGEVLGRHRGTIRYTIGQRKGLGVACAHPVYVTEIDARANTVTLGEASDLMARGLVAGDWIWSAPAGVMAELLDDAGERGLPVGAKIRYHHPTRACRMSWSNADEKAGPPSGAFENTCEPNIEGCCVTVGPRGANTDDHAVRIVFDEPERGIAPGQAVVVYAGDVVLGGGTVIRALK